MTFTGAQHRQLHILRVTGWTVNVRRLDDTTRQLHVDGVDRYGDEFTGVIDARGTLVGQPADSARAPERFGRSL